MEPENGKPDKRTNPDLHYSRCKENYALLSPYKVAGNFFWKDDQTLVMQIRYLRVSAHGNHRPAHRWEEINDDD